jgi:TonB family protein
MRNARALIPLCFIGLVTLASAADREAGMTTVLMSLEQPVEGGHWKYILSRSAVPWSCGGKNGQQTCVDAHVSVDNQSARTLECKLSVDYKAPDGRMLASFDAPAVVLPRSQARVHRQVIIADTLSEVRRLDCISRAPYQRVAKVEGCTYDMKGPALEEYYPPSAVRQSLEGPVIVAFTLPKDAGKATGAVVAESSLVPELDTAALKFIADQRFTTPCPGTRFDVRIRFQLRTQIVTRN